MFIARRLYRKEKNAAHSRWADWWLLIFLLVLALTGFWIEIVVTFKIRGMAHDVVLLIHTIMAMELVLLVAVTKLAHAVYRPLALFFHYLRINEEK